MKPRLPTHIRASLAFLAFLFALFLLLTPFESPDGDHSMFPKFLVAGLGLALAGPLLLITPIKPKVSTLLVLAVLACVVLHAVAVRPAPVQFVLLICANFMVAIVLYEASFNWRKQFEAAILCVLAINIAVIVVQACSYYLLTSTIIDFHRFLFGSESRFAEDYLNIARFSGLQVEPGTYANYISCLLAILILSSAFSKRVLYMSFVSILSIFLTNSGSAVYFVPLLIMLMGVVWPRSISPRYLLLLLAAIAVYLLSSGFVEHLEARFLEHDDGSLSHRVDGITAYLATGLEEKFIGIGFATDLCVDCFYQDIGVSFNLLTRGGVLVALALALLLVRALRVNGIALALLVFLIPLNEKMSFYDAAIWLVLLFGSSRVRPVKLRAAQAPLPSRAYGAGGTQAGNGT